MHLLEILLFFSVYFFFRGYTRRNHTHTSHTECLNVDRVPLQWNKQSILSTNLNGPQNCNSFQANQYIWYKWNEWSIEKSNSIEGEKKEYNFWWQLKESDICKGVMKRNCHIYLKYAVKYIFYIFTLMHTQLITWSHTPTSNRHDANWLCRYYIYKSNLMDLISNNTNKWCK